MVQEKLLLLIAAHRMILYIRGIHITQWRTIFKSYLSLSSNCSLNLLYIWIDPQQIPFSWMHAVYCYTLNNSNKLLQWMFMFQDVRALWPPRSTWNMLATKQRRFERRRCCIGKKRINHITSCGTCRQARVASCEFQGKKTLQDYETFNRCLEILTRIITVSYFFSWNWNLKRQWFLFNKKISLKLSIFVQFCIMFFFPKLFTLDSQVVLAPPFDTHHGRCCWAGIPQTSRSLARHLFEGDQTMQILGDFEGFPIFPIV